jgi:hypothetical protein
MDDISTDIKFAIVPVWLMEANPSNAALRVYIALARRADNGTGQAWPGRSTIGREAGVSLRSVDRGIAELELLGALSKQRRLNDDGHYKSSLYVVYRARRGSVMGDTSAMGDTTPCHMSTKELDPKNYTNKAAESDGQTDQTLTVLTGKQTESSKSAIQQKHDETVNVEEADSSYAARLLQELENVNLAPDLDEERLADNYLKLHQAAKQAGKAMDGVTIALTLALLERTFGGMPKQARGMVARLVKANGPTAVMHAAVTTAGSSVGMNPKYGDDPLGPVRYLAGVARGRL